MKRLHILVHGRVQGVGYRWFARDCARRLKIGGWVRNLPGREVELEAQGEETALENLCGRLREGPALARVTDIQVEQLPCRDDDTAFGIRY